MILRFGQKSCNLRSTFAKYWKNDNFLRGIITKNLYSSQIVTEEIKKKSILYKNLFAKIKACGPITVADYTKEVLTHPTEGYYMKKDVFGKDGDFITSPEITQLFGEMIGVWIINELLKISKDSFQLVELGPGRGTLSRDILRVFKQLKLIDRLSLHLVEISPALSAIQSKNLCESSEEINQIIDERENRVTHYREGFTKDGVKVFWYRSVKDVPKKFSVFVAHEFFDALPIRKFQKNNEVWKEILIDIDESSDEEKFRYVVTRNPTPASKLFISDNEKRDHVEVSPQTITIIDYLASFLSEFGGFGLIIDYGHSGEKTDTFRAFQKHEQRDPLSDPGKSDLTADVDFSMITKVAKRENRLLTFGPVSQRIFLKQLGIDVRLQMLLTKASDEDKSLIESGYHMIMDRDKMGDCFKVISLFPNVLKDHLTKWPVVGFQREEIVQEESTK